MRKKQNNNISCVYLKSSKHFQISSPRSDAGNGTTFTPKIVKRLRQHKTKIKTLKIENKIFKILQKYKQKYENILMENKL